MSDFSYVMGTNPGQEFEVGWACKGIPTSEQKRAALQELLDSYGTEVDIWQCTPEIRLSPMGTSISDWGRGPVVIMDDFWAAYGVLKDKPEVGWIPEGVRMPVRD